MQLGMRHLVKSLLGRAGLTLRTVGRDRLLEVRGVDAEQRRVDRTDWMATEHLVGLLERYQIETVLDVGANEGQFGAALRHSGYHGRLISFEPASPPGPVWRRAPLAIPGGKSRDAPWVPPTRPSN